MQFENIRLVGIDLDETLLRADKTVSEKTINILKKLSEADVHIVPITGRPFSGLPAQLLKIDKIRYAVCSNGAQIMDIHTGKALFSNVISNKNANKIIDLLCKNDCNFEVFCGGVGYIEQKEYDLYIKTFSNTPFGDYVLNTRTVVKSQKEIFSDNSTGADDFFIICKDEKHRESLFEQLRAIDGIQFCRFQDRFLEVTSVYADKGNGLKTICRHLGIELKNTMAFGDDANDIKLLQCAGISVAMENAIEAVKETADVVTLSNNDDGVAYILEQLKIE